MQTLWFKITEEQSLPNGLPCLWRCFIEFIDAISLITDKSNLTSDAGFNVDFSLLIGMKITNWLFHLKNGINGVTFLT